MPLSLRASALSVLLVSGCTQQARLLDGDLARVRPAPRTFQPLTPIDPAAREGSAIALAKTADHRLAFVADEDEDAVHVVDLDDRREVARTSVPGRPTRILVSPKGDLLVTLRGAAALVSLSLGSWDQPLVETRRLHTADEPIALAFDEKRETVFVASGYGRKLEAFGLDGSVSPWISLPHEARAISVVGKRVFVGYLGGPGGASPDGGVGVVDLAHHVMHLESVTMPGATETVHLRHEVPCDVDFAEGFFCGPGRTDVLVPRVARQTFALVAAPGDKGAHVLAPLELVGAGEAMVRSSGYGATQVEPVVSEIVSLDASTGRLSRRPRRHEARTGECRLPRAALFDEGTGALVVACVGNGELMAYPAHDELPGDAVWARRAVAGVTALARDPERHTLLTFSSFERRLGMITTSKDKPLGDDGFFVSLWHVDGLGLSADAMAGRALFHAARDLRISRDGRACASCHPDGRDDGLVWPTPNGPRQTFTLAGRVNRKGPFGWDAEHPTIEKHLEVTLANLGGTGLPEKARSQLAAYLRSLPSPRTEKPATPAIEHGRALFASKSTGCTDCHASESRYTDGEAHEVESATKADRKKTFLAPSLLGLAGTAPYFHDGRYTNLRELLHACKGTMGDTTHLTSQEMDDLESFLRWL